VNAYAFLILSVLLAVPGLVIYIARPSFRSVIHRLVLCSLPFALTERFFYPDYWEPETLFDLVPRIGFGIEDVLFVSGLGAFTGTVYAFVHRASFTDGAFSAKRAASVLGVAFGATLLTVALSVPTIYASVAIMVIIALVISLLRRDLFWPALLGAIYSGVFYTALCFLLMIIIPDVFALNWNTEKFLDLYLLGIPVEEILYALSAGAVATVFYPYVWQAHFES
jgi:hypothetical protein